MSWMTKEIVADQNVASTLLGLEEAKAYFPGLQDKTFLDAACVSLAPSQARDAMIEFLDMALGCREVDASKHHIEMDATRQHAVSEAARLLNAPLDNVALIESTTHGLNIAANAIPLAAGDSVVIADTEFLQVAIPWVQKRDRDGIVVKLASSQNGVLTTESFERAVDSRTRVICVSSVQWSSGNRLDIGDLAELCRSRDIWLVVDAIQELGVMEVNVLDQDVDFLIAGGHKWLNSPFGCGVMYLSDRVLRELEPSSFGYLSLDEPEGGWDTFFRTPGVSPVRDYNFPRTAKRFEIGGTANYPGAIALGQSLQIINAIGILRIEQHVRHLTDLLHEELEECGARLVSDPSPSARSGITTFTYHDTPEKDHAMLQRILEDRVLISMRYTGSVGGLRVSTHFYNTEDDIGEVISSLKGRASS